MISPQFEQLLAEICNGDLIAHDFICKWAAHCHRVDDIIDGDVKDKASILKAFMAAGDVVLHPFFQKHIDRLYPVRFLVANAYADSVELSDSKFPEDKVIADILRFCGNEMLLMVAAITTKEDEQVWDRVRRISIKLRRLSYVEHHKKETGEPV